MDKTVQAIESYDKATKLDPDNSIAYFRIGERLQELGKYEALEYYDKSLSLLSNSSFVDKVFKPDKMSKREQALIQLRINNSS